jgi:hypothetical protein
VGYYLGRACKANCQCGTGGIVISENLSAHAILFLSHIKCASHGNLTFIRGQFCVTRWAHSRKVCTGG